ncbi:MAG: hypothetical protein WDA16_07660 [Candidatus Thermoplasmatota archaeon]
MSETGEASVTDIRHWEPQRRRTGSLIGLGAAVLIIVIALAVFFLAGDKPWLDWTLVGLLVLVLAFVILLMVMGSTKREARTPEGIAHDAHVGPAGPGPMTESAPPQAAATTMTLRCGDCGTVFDIQDTGDRPLYHTCPGCGAEGVLKAEGTVAAPSVTNVPVDSSPSEAAAPAAPPLMNAPRRLKLRCGGCKEVFVIEDSGERPLRRPCPHCGRMGEIR